MIKDFPHVDCINNKPYMVILTFQPIVSKDGLYIALLFWIQAGISVNGCRHESNCPLVGPGTIGGLPSLGNIREKYFLWLLKASLEKVFLKNPKISFLTSSLKLNELIYFWMKKKKIKNFMITETFKISHTTFAQTCISYCVTQCNEKLKDIYDFWHFLNMYNALLARSIKNKIYTFNKVFLC